MAPFDAPAIPLGSTVLVTGVNGLVGSHVADQLLEYGYKVRGTVRDAQKNSWVAELFHKKHGVDSFELVQVEDIAQEGAFDNAVKGVAGVAHVASILSMSPDPNEVIPPVIAATSGILKSAAKEPSVKRFVLTSSGAAAHSSAEGTDPNAPPPIITAATWNEADVKEAWAPPPYTPERGLAVYSASKTLGEQAFFKFAEENKPKFTVNSVLPALCLGKSLDSKNQGYPSTIGFTAALFKNDLQTHNQVFLGWPRFFFVNVQDVARLHVIALIHPEVNNERIFALTHPANWNDVLAILRKLYPDRQFPDNFPDAGQLRIMVDPMDRAETLLKELGRPGLMSLEETVKANVEDLAN